MWKAIGRTTSQRVRLEYRAYKREREREGEGIKRDRR